MNEPIILNTHDGGATLYLTPKPEPEGATLSWKLVGYVYEGLDIFLDVDLTESEVQYLADHQTYDLPLWMQSLAGRPAAIRVHSWHRKDGHRIPIQMPAHLDFAEIYPWRTLIRDGTWHEATGSGE